MTKTDTTIIQITEKQYYELLLISHTMCELANFYDQYLRQSHE